MTIPGRIIIATPLIDLSVSALHYASAWQLMSSTEIGVIDSQLLVDCDLVRARSRAVRVFLEESKGEHLLFWDSDVEASAVALRGMIAENVDMIGCAYPKKIIRLGEVRPRDFAVYTAGKRIAFTGSSAEVDGLGLGFTLLSRHLLSLMVERFKDSLTFWDGDAATVALFMLAMGPDPEGKTRLWPEDYSFCQRVREVGSSVRLYTGPGSPLAHQGSHTFRGQARDIHPEEER